MSLHTISSVYLDFRKFRIGSSHEKMNYAFTFLLTATYLLNVLHLDVKVTK